MISFSSDTKLPHDPKEQKLLSVLKQTFGYDSFRPHQQEIVTHLLNGIDVMAVMPTGGGKSLCYQLPAKVMTGTAVIISPLISLMKDQVDAARENNLQAAYINSSLSSTEAISVYRQLHSGTLDLLYISPERFALSSFVETLQKIQISFFAIDEAHCMSEWGHDFRPDYLGLSSIRKHFPDAPIGAFTATATSPVQNDILKKLKLHKPLIVRASFNRPNLFYEVQPKNHVDTQILKFLRQHPDEPGIVYRLSRDSVEKTAEFLNAQKIKALPYHAGLHQGKREANQVAFNRDEVQVMVATIAFGMGIDKSNVRFVLHADLPKNLEGYYQETGRAGRDGEPSHCLLFYGGGDIPKLRHFLELMPDGAEKERANAKLQQMIHFASRCQCRRSQLLAYFEETYPEDNCNSCDICKGMAETEDVTREAQMALSAVIRTGERFGGGHIIDVLLGAETQKIQELNHHNLKTYGVGKHRPKDFWRFLVSELVARNVLAVDSGPYPILKLTEACAPLLQGLAEFAILKFREKEKTKKTSSSSASTASANSPLFEKLRSLRKELAQRQNLPPYMVFSDKTLQEMCRHLPVTLTSMREISGVGESKLDRYGVEFVQVIREFKD